jgi:zinc protease
MMPAMMIRTLIAGGAIVAPGTAVAPPSGLESNPRQDTSAQQTDTLTTTFEVNGLRVILRRNTANDVIGASLYLLGGTKQLTPATQGIEAFLLLTSERGTQKYPGPMMRQRTARLGTDILVSPSKDWTAFGLRTIRATFDSSWALFADRVMRPTLAPSEVDFIRSQMLSGLRQVSSDPDQLVEELADSVAFAGHPYGLSPEGTIRSVQSITANDLRGYHRSSFVTSRMLLVVVGNVDRGKLEQLIRGSIATLPRGNYSWEPPAPLVDQSRAVVVREAPLPTNYLLGYYAGPSATNADYAALRLAAAVLAGRFFTEIRSKQSLSYAADAPFIERAIATGGVYVTTVDPNRTLDVMRREIDRLQSEPIEREGLDRLVGQFITDYFLKNETNLDQANFLARAAIYQGDYRRADQFVSELRRVAPEDVRRVAREYMRNFRFAYVGNPSRLNRSLLDQF